MHFGHALAVMSMHIHTRPVSCCYDKRSVDTLTTADNRLRVPVMLDIQSFIPWSRSDTLEGRRRRGVEKEAHFSDRPWCRIMQLI